MNQCTTIQEQAPQRIFASLRELDRLLFLSLFASIATKWYEQEERRGGQKQELAPMLLNELTDSCPFV
jgi:hypothetical protein